MRPFIERLLGFDKYYFEKVIIEQEVIENICSMANDAYPNEFFAYLKGTINKKVLKINGLYVQAYNAGPDQTVYRLSDMPMSAEHVGTVHSHPGKSRPSDADLSSFQKSGFVHIIISRPYSQKDISLYDMKGNEINYDIT